MKKEYLILVLLICALSVYLVVKKDNRQNYTLPNPIKIEKGEIDKIVITQNNLPMEIAKEGERWVVSDKKYPADMTAVNRMLDTARNLKVSGLISESQEVIRYELDDDHAIEVKTFRGNELLISFKIGKTAPSANHTFIMLAGDTRIFQADKSFKAYFNVSVDALRNKQVLTFKQDAIKRVTIKKDGVSKTMTPVPPKDGTETSAVSWKFEDGTSPDKAALNNLLSSLSFLKCEQFPEDLSTKDLEKESPICKIILENETQIVLNLFDRNNDDSMVGTSSMNPYAFVLESHKSKDILSYADKLAKPIKEEKETNKKE